MSDIETRSSREVQRRFGAVLDAVLSGAVIVVERNKRRIAVIVPYDEWQELQERSRMSREIEDEQERRE